MHPAVDSHATYDVTNVPAIVNGAVKLGLIECIMVVLVSIVSHLLPNGALQTILVALLVLVGLAAVTLLPGLWTRARTIEGIAGAAGIGLGATLVFLLVDVTLLQNLGVWGTRWQAIGGDSDWWYHPVWWMVGTFLPWFGAWMLAGQLVRGGQVSPVAAFVTALACAVVLAIVAVLIHVPLAGWNLGTFAVAFLPGLALAKLLTSLGAARRA